MHAHENLSLKFTPTGIITKYSIKCTLINESRDETSKKKLSCAMV